MGSARATYRHGDLYEAGVETATALVEETGSTELSMREVARRIGVSHTAFYHHFPDKASLLAAVAERGFVELTREMTADITPGGEPLAQLRVIGIGYVRFALDHPGVFRLMFRRDLTNIDPTEPPPVIGASWELLRRAVSACQSAGFAQNEPLDLLATLCWSSVHGVATLLLDGPLGPVGNGRHASRERTELADQVVLVLNRLIEGPTSSPAS